jgi:hypothetical protein
MRTPLSLLGLQMLASDVGLVPTIRHNRASRVGGEFKDPRWLAVSLALGLANPVYVVVPPPD